MTDNGIAATTCRLIMSLKEYMDGFAVVRYEKCIYFARRKPDWKKKQIRALMSQKATKTHSSESARRTLAITPHVQSVSARPENRYINRINKIQIRNSGSRYGVFFFF